MCLVPGLYFEAYDIGPHSGGNPVLGATLATMEAPLWNGWTPAATHLALGPLDGRAIWYSNEEAFFNGIPDLSSNDYFYMRWRGLIVIDEAAQYDFKTRSDDGSFIFIDGEHIVDNDGWHGMQDATGSATLSASQHSITILFSESHGGCGLEVSWRQSGGDWAPLSTDVLQVYGRPAYPSTASLVCFSPYFLRLRLPSSKSVHTFCASRLT
jgi:hypothetical protein